MGSVVEGEEELVVPILGELSAAEIGNLIFIGSFVGYFTGFLFSARLHHLFDKRATIVATAVGLSIFPALPLFKEFFKGHIPDGENPQVSMQRHDPFVRPHG